MKVKNFSIVKNGYDIEEVNKFLKVVTTEFEKLVVKNTELEATIESLSSTIEELEAKTNSVDGFIEELDSYIEIRKEDKKTIEIELGILEQQVEDYKKLLNTIFYDHMELINKVK